MTAWKDNNTLLTEGKESKQSLVKTKSSGSYGKIFGETIGQAITYAHSSTIKRGFILENVLYKLTDEKGIKVLNENLTFDLIGNHLDKGTYLLGKDAFFKSELCLRKDPITGKRGVQPDIIILTKDIDNKTNEVSLSFKIIELKLGYNFDTKKSESEVIHLKKEMEFLEKNFLDIGIHTTCQKYLCSWNMINKNVISTGTKGNFSVDEILIGEELCSLLGITYEDADEASKGKNDEIFYSFLKQILNDEKAIFYIIKSIKENPLLLDKFNSTI